MESKRKTWPVLGLLFVPIAWLGAQTPAKANFSGSWNLNLQKSTLQIPPPSASMFRIDHKEPQFHLSRTHFYGEKSETWSIDLTTDGKEVYQKDGNLESWTRLYWQRNSLVFDQKLKLNGKDGTNVVRYTLTDEGRTLIAVERMKTPKFSHYNYWVFEKQ